MLKNLIHDGDMFGIVTTGTSSISVQLTYDRQVLDSAVQRITGDGLKPKEIIEGMQGSNGPTELRYRAHVAFSTAYDLMQNLEKLQNRRKAVIYISSGYDFNPFEKGAAEETSAALAAWRTPTTSQSDPFYRNQQSSQLLAESDLVRELAEVTRAANRANATLYTIDPRGLVAGQDIDEEVDIQDWNDVPARDAGQPARAGRADRRHRGRQPERLRQGAEADRRRDERLLRARLLLEQSRPAAAHAQDRGEDHAAERERGVADVVLAAAAPWQSRTGLSWAGLQPRRVSQARPASSRRSGRTAASRRGRTVSNTFITSDTVRGSRLIFG